MLNLKISKKKKKTCDDKKKKKLKFVMKTKAEIKELIESIIISIKKPHLFFLLSAFFFAVS